MPKLNLPAAAALALIILMATGAAGCNRSWSGGDDTNRRLADLENSQQALLKEVKEIKALLQNRAPAAPQAPGPVSAPANIDLAIDGAASRGRADAKLTVIEYSDFQCPFCGRYAKDTYPQVEREYVATGKIRYLFRHFPLERLHPDALRAAEAAECARAQGKFWEMHELLFNNQPALGQSDLPNYAKAIGMDVARFQQCLAGPAAATVRADMDVAARAGVSGTPTFFVGVTRPDGKIHVLRKLSGALPFNVFKTTIDGLLASPDALK